MMYLMNQDVFLDISVPYLIVLDIHNAFFLYPQDSAIKKKDKKTGLKKTAYFFFNFKT